MKAPSLTLFAAAFLLLPAVAFGDFATGTYRGKTSRNGAVALRVGTSKVSRFSIAVLYKCTDGDRFRATEKGFPTMRIRHGKFSRTFSSAHGAAVFKISGKLRASAVSGEVSGRARYDTRNRFDRNGPVVCRTRTVKFKGKLAGPKPPTALPTPTPNAPQAVERSCSSLPGSGSFSNPLVIGTVTRTTVVRGCSPLTSGSGYNLRYFSFTLASPAPSGSLLASLFQITPAALSAVHPRLATPGGLTLMTSSSNGLWLGDPSAPYGRALPAGGLVGSYVLGMEKLDSPLRSLTTPPFDVAIALR